MSGKDNYERRIVVVIISGIRSPSLEERASSILSHGIFTDQSLFLGNEVGRFLGFFPTK